MKCQCLKATIEHKTGNRVFSVSVII